tara:strand:- start:291 stop:608 length:318 start_codon:yes stop_codon:yes gene_type:complete
MKIKRPFTDILAINSKKLENVLPKFNGENKEMYNIEIDLIHPFAKICIGKLFISQLNINFDINNYIDKVSIVAFYENKNKSSILDGDSVNYLEKYLTKYYLSQRK